MKIKIIILFIVLNILTISAFAQTKCNNKTQENKDMVLTTFQIESSQYENILSTIKSLKTNENEYYTAFIGLLKILIPFLLGIFAVPLTKKLFDTAKLDLIFDKDDNECAREFKNNNEINDIDYRIKVKNTSKKVIARKCSLRITLFDIKPDDTKDCEEGKAYITTKNQFTSITNEYLLWDFNYDGKSSSLIDIIPQSYDKAAFAKYRKNNGDPYWEIPSENSGTAKIFLKCKNIRFKISVYSENIGKVNNLEIELKMPE